MPLLEGLLSGSRKASRGNRATARCSTCCCQIMAYLQAKRSGQSDIQLILTALLNLRRGSFGTAQSPRGYGRRRAGSDTSRADRLLGRPVRPRCSKGRLARCYARP
ncbi:MAG: hypothetical protein U0Z44_21955 [Kouleothrix sp.]